MENLNNVEVLHVEVARNPRSNLKRAEIERLVREALRNVDDPSRDFCLNDAGNCELKRHVNSINFCSLAPTWNESTNTTKTSPSTKANFIDFSSSNSSSNLSVLGSTLKNGKIFAIHIFELNDGGENAEFLDDEEEDGQSASSHHWILPSASFHSLWDSLIFESEVKTRLMDYVLTAALYADMDVNESLISWNKVVLLHGPPGTGKTSLCKALAHKAAIRLGSRFSYGQLIEINSHSLFSKWFSESGKLVMKMFEKIQEFAEDRQCLVFLLIDEVESLAQCRLSAESGNEPSDSIRAVNALLTQIDRIKKYPNVVILTTSNVAGSIDLAFVDRADLKIFIGNPPVEIIYSIYASSLNELIRVGIIISSNNVLMPAKLSQLNSAHPAHDATQQLFEISKLSLNLSGRALRKIPFLTHVNFVKRERCTLPDFLCFMKKAIEIEKNEISAVKTGNSC